MANITKTFIYPLPTTWKGQDQDDANVGVATYIGPEKLVCWFEKDANGDKTKKFVQAFASDYPQLRSPAANHYAVELDANLYPMHAACLFGGIVGPQMIEISAGPSADPNPKVQDPAHFNEVYDLRTFDWDPALNSGAGGWSTPKFSSDSPGGDEATDGTFGWEWVRDKRNNDLNRSDTRISEDMPTDLKDKWKAYRQKLRDIPTDWAGIGTSTYLIVWPCDPDEQLNTKHIQVSSGVGTS